MSTPKRRLLKLILASFSFSFSLSLSLSLSLPSLFLLLLLLLSLLLLLLYVVTLVMPTEYRLSCLIIHAVTIQYTNFPKQPQKATEGQTVTLPCVVKAFPVPQQAWKKDGVLVTNDSRHLISGTGLKIQQVGTSDMGRYYCVAWNRGSVQAKSTLLLIVGKNVYTIIRRFLRGLKCVT